MKRKFLRGATLGLTLSAASSLALASLASATTITTEHCSEFVNAVNAAESGDTIVLGLNCTKHITISGNKSITIDLAGNRLSEYSSFDVITVEEGSTLEITDSVGGGVVKAGNTNQLAINNAGTTDANNVIIWGDINNAGALNFEGVTLDPENYYPYPTYTITNSGTLTTSGEPAANLFKGTPITNTGTVELTAATFTARPDDSFVPEGYEIVEEDGKFIVRPVPTTPEEPTEPTEPTEPENPTEPEDPSNTPTEPTETPTNNEPTKPVDQTLDEEDPSLDPLGETYTVAPTVKPATNSAQTPAVPNTGDKEEVKEVGSTMDINLILFAMAFGFGALLIVVFIKGKHAANEKVMY